MSLWSTPNGLGLDRLVFGVSNRHRVRAVARLSFDPVLLWSIPNGLALDALYHKILKEPRGLTC